MEKVITFILALLLSLLISYGMTVGIFYLVCLCFDVEFNIVIATGVWLIVQLLKGLF